MRKAFRVTFKVVLVAAAAIGLFLLIAQDQETLRIRAAVPASDPQALHYVAKLTGAGITRGTGYTILNNGDEIFPAMLEAIGRAAHRISFETYIYEKGATADRFTAALEAAARRGVQVNLLVDSFGGGSMEDSHIERLRQAGARVETFNPAAWWELEELNYRTHRKILVIDGEVAFTGGAGIADHWQGHAQDPDHWRDIQVRMNGPAARAIEGGFYENFIEAGDKVVTPVLDPEPPPDGELGNVLLVRSSPSGGSSDLKRLYLLLIAMAQHTIDIQSPYFVTDDSSAWAIDEALARGVRIRILTESDMTDAKPVKYASRKAYQHLLDKGAEIYEYQPTMMHAKVMVVDGVWSMFGSANFDNRSLELNDELNVAVMDADLAGRFVKTFESDRQRAKRLTLEQWARRGWLEKSREWFWQGFGEIF